MVGGYEILGAALERWESMAADARGGNYGRGISLIRPQKKTTSDEVLEKLQQVYSDIPAYKGLFEEGFAVRGNFTKGDGNIEKINQKIPKKALRRALKIKCTIQKESFLKAIGL